MSCALPLPADDTLPASQCLPVLRLQAGSAVAATDQLIAEVPVAMVYNGISHAVLLASPADLHDFALGFALSEGILTHASELYDCEAWQGEAGIELRLDIASARFSQLKARRRNMAGRTGCGLCGVDSLDAVAQTIAPLPLRPTLHAASIARAVAALPAQQPLHAATGAAHGAAYCHADGSIVLVREDVGRHNALDKLIGALRRQGVDTRDGFVLVSSRASYEMVQKTAQAGIPALIAVSAPTAYAAQLAGQCGLLLAGFARPGRLVAYTHTERLITATATETHHVY
ncbi:formate dehydrogenase accessory sulfurtransferase FdhD [Vogesella mureinivorans]|uniref:formate dehydrogenase accessory sulfurtransferase FdhD n=1 Tax=Vogesella mureinivorans TaxID=657276 RepID=UPI0011C91E99|nr:formate dehydrogenase accessory sulfurtransferase FdhD [Vogesella mureinivorans]